MTYTEDQSKAIKIDSGNVLVSASAGSGKTSVMIERIVRLITEGKVRVNELLAVTFTESAGAEMKSKLKSKLTEKVKSGDGIAEQLNDIRSADICTIDSFCSRLVRSYFYEVGISPDYEICDDNRGRELKERAITAVFRKHYQDKDGFIKYVDRYAVKRNDTPIKEAVFGIYAKLSTEAYFDEKISEYNGLTFDTVLQELLSMLKDKAEAIKTELEEYASFLRAYSNVPKLSWWVDELIGDVTRISESDGIYDAVNLPPNDKRFSVEKLEDESLIEIKERVHSIKRELSKMTKDEFAKYLTNYGEDKAKFENAKENQAFFLSLVKEFKEQFDKLKREENVLDFSDLERFALEILQNPVLLKQIKSKYKYIFVDEYQDVNGIQEEIITTLASDNVFMVGDEKQSIYGFRGCVPEFFNSKFTAMEKGGEQAIKLNDNFRSSKSVVDSVNEVFSFCMRKQRYGIDYAMGSRLIYGNGYGEHEGRACLHLLYKEGTEKKAEEPRIYDIKEEVYKEQVSDDNLTVSLVTNIINEELGKEYFDVKKGKMKKVTLGDIVILSRLKNGEYINGLIRGLIAHGINVSASAEEDVCDYPEVQTMINFLRLIDCFYQDVPLLSVLKSNIVDCTDYELSEIADFFKDNVKEKDEYYNSTFTQAVKFYMEKGEGELKEKLCRFYEYLGKIRFLKDFASAGELLERVIDDYNLYPRIMATKGGDVKVNRLKRVVSYCNENSFSVSDFLRRVDSGKKAITLSSGGDGNSVRIMSIHASKGLEFPVVILVGLEKQFNKEDIKGNYLYQREYGFAFKSFDDENRTVSENVFRKLLKQKIPLKTEKEEARLLYVALTRASYALHMTAIVGEDKRKDSFDGAGKLLDFIPKSYPAREYGNSSLAVVNMRKSMRQVIISQETPTGIEIMKKKFAFLYPHLKDTALPLKSNVTEANRLNREEEKTVNLFGESENPSKAEQGITAHKIMQYYDFTVDGFYEQVNGKIGQGIITEEMLKSIDSESIKAVCESSELRELSRYKLYREQGFICKIDSKAVFGDNGSDSEILLQGVIDLLAIDGDKAYIVDYKYSSKGKDELIKEYRKQLELYAFAVEKVLKKKVVKKTIVSLCTGERVEIV